MSTGITGRVTAFLIIAGMASGVFALLLTTGADGVYGATAATVKNGPLNVRSNAGTGYKKLGSLAKGKTIAIRAVKKDSSGQKWYKITYKSKTGYILAKYVKLNPSPGSLKKYSPAKKGVMKNGPVNLRTNAGTEYTKAGSVKKNAAVTVLGQRAAKNKALWYQIKYGSKTGYVLAKYVTLKADASASAAKPAETAVNKTGTVKNGPLNVRTGPGTGYSKLGSVAKGKNIKVLAKAKNAAGETWYKFAYSSSKNGYVLSDYVALNSDPPAAENPSGLSDEEFEAWMTEQGFPSGYKSRLRSLHKAHPKWIFKAQQTGLSWPAVLEKEGKIGVNLVEPTSPASWKSKASGAYDARTKTYTKFDGRWNAASESIIAYYMDPRNFLNEDFIYQFMDHSFDSASQTKNTIKSMVSQNGCFMNTADYIACLYNAGKSSGVNPNVITAMVIQEQGWKGGSGLISGNYPGYEGYYNHFNIGAYTAGTMTAVQRGLWWAKGAGTGADTYGRPWTTIEKSLYGGAAYYSGQYLDKGQYTYYTKKFNVMNGLNAVASHQYMTNTLGAESEGKLLKAAYEASDDYPAVFHIPVYSGMPSATCPRPE